MLSTAKIAKKLGQKKEVVTKALIALGYQYKSTKGSGYFIESLFENLGKQKFFNDKKNSIKVPYVLWNDSLIEDSGLLKELNIQKTNDSKFRRSRGKSKADLEKMKETKIKKTFKFDRKQFDSNFRTSDGHFVRSRAEVVIDDWLYNNKVMHAIEKRLPIKEELYCDFYLPEGNIYIEYAEFDNNTTHGDYIARRKVKEALYKEHGVNVIWLGKSDIENIDDMLPLKLLDFGVKFV